MPSVHAFELERTLYALARFMFDGVNDGALAQNVRFLCNWANCAAKSDAGHIDHPGFYLLNMANFFIANCH